MLNLLSINNIALIDELRLEFAPGLNLLTGETGSGKSIIVDSLGALTGERVSSDIIKEGTTNARIEGLFTIEPNGEILNYFEEAGLEIDRSELEDLIVRRELSATGKNRIFVNNQLVTQNFLKKIGAFLVDIHGQGEQQTLFDPRQHLEMLDDYAGLGEARRELAEKYRQWQAVLRELDSLRQDEAQKLQLVDVLQFQIDEIQRANLQPAEDEELETERRRLMNVEKLSALSDDAYALLYETSESTISTLAQVAKNVDELTNYDAQFSEYTESLNSASAVLEDLAITLRSFRSNLEFSPERLGEIENRLAEISRLKRKYNVNAPAPAPAHLRRLGLLARARPPGAAMPNPGTPRRTPAHRRDNHDDPINLTFRRRSHVRSPAAARTRSRGGGQERSRREERDRRLWLQAAARGARPSQEPEAVVPPAPLPPP